MKTLILSLGLLAFFPSSDDLAPSGRMLEARDAAVFAGGCHVNSEMDHQGRVALLAFTIEKGSFAGVSLAGVQVAAAIESRANLARGEDRRALVFVEDGITGAQHSALVAWLRAEHSDTLGAIQEVIETDVDVVFEGDAFRLSVPGALTLNGKALADRSCCTMPEQRWYAPLSETTRSIVGYTDECSFEGRGKGKERFRPWSYQSQNSAFVGRF